MNVFLATAGDSLTRAACTPDGRWTVETLLPGQPMACLAADPLQPGVIYAGTRGRGLLRSTDFGRAWTPAGLDGCTVTAVAASPPRSGLLYAGTRPAHLFISRDYGAHWDELAGFRRIRSRRFWFSPASPPYTAYVQGIALSPADPGVILAGIEFGAVVRSADGGQTWTGHRPGALRDCHSLCFHPTNGDWAYEGGGTGAGAAASQDGGITWRQHRPGLDRHYGWACAADPLHPDVWYCSAAPSPSKAHYGGRAQARIYKREGAGDWQPLSGGLPEPLTFMPYALLTDLREPQAIYAGLSSGQVWHSPDRGASWQPLPFTLPAIHYSLLMLAE